MQLFTELNSQQKEAIVLLQIGTFLEYFDLMLYVHMAVFLNEIFFPPTDAYATSLLAALAFCSTYVLRPFGALMFGYLGDNIGRKSTVIITSIMMAASCLVMATLPTYAQIGILASWIAIACRVIQGLSSLGEIIGAEIYLTETIKPPARYPTVALLSVSSFLGAACALGIASLVTMYELNWRNAFWVGAVIAVVGFRARTHLRETIEFADMQRRIKKAQAELEKEWIDNVISMVGFVFRKRLRETLEFAAARKQIKKIVEAVEKEKINWQTILAFFLIYCGWPVFFYFTYIYCGNLLKSDFGFTAVQVIRHNFVVSLSSLASGLIFSCLSYKLHPLKILAWKQYIFIPFILLTPYLLTAIKSSYMIMLFQSFCIFFAASDVPAASVLVVHFPIFKRFTCVSFIYALSRALVYIITSFGLVLVTKYLGHFGLWVIMLPTLVGFSWGVKHFTSLEYELEFLNKRDTLSRHLKAQGLR